MGKKITLSEESKFRGALIALSQLGDEPLAAFTSKLTEAPSAWDIRHLTWMNKTARELSLDASVLMNGLAAIVAIAMASRSSGQSVADGLREKVGGAADAEGAERLVRFAEATADVLDGLTEHLDTTTPPPVPIRQYEGVKTRVLKLAEMAEEFNVYEDDLGGYKPQVRLWHTFAILDITTSGPSPNHLSFRLGKAQLDDFIQFLRFTRIQLEAIQDEESTEG